LTPIERTEAIKDLCESDLPALLDDAGLSNFDEYRNKTPLKSNDKELCVYIAEDMNSPSENKFLVLIQVQIYGNDEGQEYHSVIMPFLEQELTADIVEYTDRDSISADVWAMDVEKMTTFLWYEIEFTEDKDGCDD